MAETEQQTEAPKPAKGEKGGKSGAGAKGKPAKDDDEDDKPAAPFEFATTSDYQFTQALNLLKGLQIIQKN